MEVGIAPTVSSGRAEVELHAVDGAIGHVAQLSGRIHHFASQVGVTVETVHRDVATGGAAIIHGEFGSFAATARSDVDLDVSTVRVQHLAATVRTQVVRIGAGAVAVVAQGHIGRVGRRGLTPRVARSRIATGAIKEGNQQVVRAIVLKRRVEGEGVPPSGSRSNGARPHDVAQREGLTIGSGRERGTRYILHVHRHVACRVGRAVVVIETNGIDSAGSPYFISSVNLLSARVVKVIVDGKIVRRTSPFANRNYIRFCHAHEGEQKCHHQRKYFLFHNDLNLVNN